MNQSLTKTIVTTIIGCILIGTLLTIGASANSDISDEPVQHDTFTTTAGVNIREGMSTETKSLEIVIAGTEATVLEHDPSGWSSVKVGGTSGFIRSDFLKFPESAPFITTSDVILRAGPSIDDDLILLVPAGDKVKVLEHDPSNWSLVQAGEAEGFVRSEFLTREGVGKEVDVGYVADVDAYDEELTELSNFEPEIVNAEDTLEYTAEALAEDAVRTIAESIQGPIIFANWSEVKNQIPLHTDLHVVDVRTGITFNLRAFSLGGHADVETPTREDTDAILESRNGVWAWDPRPVWVTIGDQTFAASLNGKPHAGSTISGNGLNGHLCLHFGETVTRSKTYQRDLRNAVDEAYNTWRELSFEIAAFDLVDNT